MKSSFNLVPFSVNTAPEFEINGNIEHHNNNNKLEIEYKLTGNLSQLIIPEHKHSPTRQYNLWENTCFEFFLGIKDSSKYWEFNLSPAGHWNVFRFDDYRQDIAEEITFDALPFKVIQQYNLLYLNLEFNLYQIINAEQNLEVGITTVIEDKEKQLSYWALTHTQKVADFHDRNSFLINL